MKYRFCILLLVFTVFLQTQTALADYKHGEFQPRQYFAVEKFLRTELYFGTDKPDGSVVTEEEWNKFLSDEVTQRFPSGFTVLEGFGQFRDASGKIVREKSKVLILLYPRNERKTSRAKIEEIRAAYVKQFSQESVLRMDLPKSVLVWF